MIYFEPIHMCEASKHTGMPRFEAAPMDWQIYIKSVLSSHNPMFSWLTVTAIVIDPLLYMLQWTLVMINQYDITITDL